MRIFIVYLLLFVLAPVLGALAILGLCEVTENRMVQVWGGFFVFIVGPGLAGWWIPKISFKRRLAVLTTSLLLANAVFALIAFSNTGSEEKGEVQLLIGMSVMTQLVASLSAMGLHHLVTRTATESKH